jgi:hypothetical protein
MAEFVRMLYGLSICSRHYNKQILKSFSWYIFNESLPGRINTRHKEAGQCLLLQRDMLSLYFPCASRKNYLIKIQKKQTF